MGTGPRRSIIEDYKVVTKVKIANVEVEGEIDGVAVMVIAHGLLGLLRKHTSSRPQSAYRRPV